MTLRPFTVAGFSALGLIFVLAARPEAAVAEDSLQGAGPAGDVVEPADPGTIPAETDRPVSDEKNDDELFDEFEEPAAPAARAARDPLIWFNRGMYHFNDKMYFWVLKPTARVYRRVLPQGMRVGVNRVFKNIAYPSRLVNNVLQWKMRGAGRETTRFLVNSTLGVGGFFDPAKKFWNIEPSEEDFGQTLGRYGLGGGFPLVLPFIGPSNLRDAVGLVPDYFMNPISYLDPHDPWFFNKTRLIVRSVETVNRTSLELGQYETLKKDALDPYTFLRDAYKQMRDRQVED